MRVGIRILRLGKLGDFAIVLGAIACLNRPSLARFLVVTVLTGIITTSATLWNEARRKAISKTEAEPRPVPASLQRSDPEEPTIEVAATAVALQEAAEFVRIGSRLLRGRLAELGVLVLGISVFLSIFEVRHQKVLVPSMALLSATWIVIWSIALVRFQQRVKRARSTCERLANLL